MTPHKRRLVLPSTPPPPPPPPPTTTCLNPLLYVQVVFTTAAVVVCLQLSATYATHKTTNRVTSYPSFQHLKIPREIASVKHDSNKQHSHHHDSHPKLNEQQRQSIITLLSNDNPSNNNNKSSSIKLNVIHRDKLISSNTKHRRRAHPDHKHRFSERIQRDAMRVLKELCPRLPCNY